MRSSERGVHGRLILILSSQAVMAYLLGCTSSPGDLEQHRKSRQVPLTVQHTAHGLVVVLRTLYGEHRADPGRLWKSAQPFVVKTWGSGEPEFDAITSAIAEFPMDYSLRISEMCSQERLSLDRFIHANLVKALAEFTQRESDSLTAGQITMLCMIAQDDKSPICRGDALLALTNQKGVNRAVLGTLIYALMDEETALHDEVIAELALDVLVRWTGLRPDIEDLSTPELRLKAHRFWSDWFSANREFLEFLPRDSSGIRIRVRER